jgi:hypothetical protein
LYLAAVGAPGYSTNSGRALVYNVVSTTAATLLYTIINPDTPTSGGKAFAAKKT